MNKTAQNIARDIQRTLERTGQQLTPKTRRPVAPTFTQAYKLAGLAIAAALMVAAVLVSQNYLVVALTAVLAAGVSQAGFALNRTENIVRAERAKSALFQHGALGVKCLALAQSLNLTSVDEIDDALIAQLAE